MGWAISRKRHNGTKEYYCGELNTYTNNWIDSKTLAVTFPEHRLASNMMEDMENGYIYQLVEVNREW